MEGINSIINKDKDIIYYKKEEIKEIPQYNETKNNTIKKKQNPKKTKKKRCTFCNAKLNMIYFDCKCGGNFCSKHRYSHTHNCLSKDILKEENKTKIEKDNPKLRASTYTNIN